MTLNCILLYSQISAPPIRKGSSGSRWDQMQRPTVRHYAVRESTLEASIDFLSLRSGLTLKRGRKGCRSQRRQRISGGHGPLNQLGSTYMSPQRWQKQPWACVGLHQDLLYVRAISLLLCETPNSVSGCNSDSFGLYLRLFSCYWIALSSRDT